MTGTVGAPVEERAAEGLEFHQLYRAGRPGWWVAGVAALPLVLVYFLVVPVVLLVPFMVGFALAGEPVLDSLARVTDLSDPTPTSLAYLNLTLAAAIPVTFLAVWALHGLRPGWLTSVAPRMRWSWFLTCIGLSVVALMATMVVATALPSPDGPPVSGEVNELTRTTFEFMVVILLLTPFQAAGEEYLFRGYLAQGLGSLVPTDEALRWLGRGVAVVVPALLFALAHGLGQSWPIFVDRLAFGLVAGVLVIATGGLEAAIAMHVLNNFLAFGLALAFSDLGSALNPTGGSWWQLPTTLTQSLVYLVLALAVFRSMGLSRRSSVRPAR
jgi:membrane protease YdiL (CAAX protease family)